MTQQRSSLKLQALVVGLVSLVIVAAFTAVAVGMRTRLRAIIVEEEISKARSVALQAESVRDYMVKVHEANIYDGKKLQGDVKALLRTVPIVAAFTTAGQKAKEAGFEFRVPKEFPRNPANQPDPQELAVLKGLQARAGEPGNPEHWFEDTKTNAIRYFRGIRLTQDCLICHGDPTTSQALWGRADGTDPTGARMEGWKAGEVHGAFEVIASLDKADQTLASTTWWIALASLLGCAGSIAIITWAMRRFVFQRLHQAAARMRDVAAGDLTAEVADERRDELNEVFDAFNAMTRGLRDLVVQMQESAQTISGACGEISLGNADLSRRTEQQAASLEQTASSMEEIASNVTHTADTARAASGEASRTREQAERGGEAMNRVVGAMSDINRSSQRIAEIIGVVDEIAFQTNLLALNAAVEAARAGEQGRGFAVVAAEVRSLAKRSADAAKEIKALIAESVAMASGGAEVAQRAGETVEATVSSVKRIADLIGDMAHAIQEQSTGVNEINQAVNQMDEATQQNAALVEQAASAAESLEDQARALAEIAARFRTGRTAAPAAVRREPAPALAGWAPARLGFKKGGRR